MIMLEERLHNTLVTLVREYIETACPVGSTRLVEVLPFQVSPATVRNILRELEDEGYIWQPHTSAGRIPTDKGYRVYVNSLIRQDLRQQAVRRLVHKLRKVQAEHNIPGRAMARFLAELAQTVAISGHLQSHEVHEAGLRLLLDQPESTDTQTVREVSLVLDDIDAVLDRVGQTDVQTQAQAFIGEENPIVPAQHTTILARQATLKDGGQVMLLLIGPKRMPYEKHMPLLNSVATIIQNL